MVFSGLKKWIYIYIYRRRLYRIAFLDFGTSKIPIGGYTTEEDAYNGRNSYIEAKFEKKMEVWKPIQLKMIVPILSFN